MPSRPSTWSNSDLQQLVAEAAGQQLVEQPGQPGAGGGADGVLGGGDAALARCDGARAVRIVRWIMGLLRRGPPGAAARSDSRRPGDRAGATPGGRCGEPDRGAAPVDGSGPASQPDRPTAGDATSGHDPEQQERRQQAQAERDRGPDADRAGPVLDLGAGRRARSSASRSTAAATGAPVRSRPGQRPAERAELGVGGQGRPDLRGVDAEGEPVAATGPAGRRPGRGARRRPGGRPDAGARATPQRRARAAATSSGRSRRTASRSRRGAAGSAAGGHPVDHDRGDRRRARARPSPPRRPSPASSASGGHEPPATVHPVGREAGRARAPQPARAAAGRGRRQRAAARRAARAASDDQRVITASPAAAIRSIHHSPASPSARPPARQASPTGVREQEGHGLAAGAGAHQQRQHRQARRPAGRWRGRRPARRRRPAGSPGRRAATGATRSSASARPRAGAVRDLPGGGDQPQVAGPGRAASSPQRRGHVAARGRAASAAGARGGQASAARSRARPRRLAGGQLGGEQLARLEHPVGRWPPRPARRRRQPPAATRRRRSGTDAPAPGRRRGPRRAASRRQDHDRRADAPAPADGPGAAGDAGRGAQRARSTAAAAARPRTTATTGHRAGRRAGQPPGPSRRAAVVVERTPPGPSSPARRRPARGRRPRAAPGVPSRSPAEVDAPRRPPSASWLCAASRLEPGGQGERLDPGRHVGRGVGVQGAAAALVAGVERGEQVDDLGAADLADDQPVGPHPQRLPHQRPQRRSRRRPRCWRGRASRPTTCGWSGRSSEASSTRTSRSARVDQGQQGGEQGGLADAGAAADQERQPRRDDRARSSRAPSVGERCRRPTSSSRVNARRRGTRSESAVPGPGDRREHGVEAGAVGEPERRRTAWRRRAGDRPAAASRWASRRTASSSGKRDVGRARARRRGRRRPASGPLTRTSVTPGEPQQRLERPGADHVAAQRLVDGEHGGVAHRSAVLPQRLGHPVRGQRRRRRRRAARGRRRPARPARPSRHAAAAARRQQLASTSRAARASGAAPGPHRPEPEVDRLGEPALVGHRGEHRGRGPARPTSA